jgi:hypothetical protein
MPSACATCDIILLAEEGMRGSLRGGGSLLWLRLWFV